jgi:hypothetical protein
MNLTTEIESAELQFKQILEGFFISIYDDKSLQSHGIDHHRRVWNFSREITMLLDYRGLISDPTLPFKLIIACYLHDIGMSVDRGIRHGHHSRELCAAFLERNDLKEIYYHDVLLAIENHDNKEYSAFTGVYDLLTILSVADDLDAFGFTGIYRYLEIYLIREIDLPEIGNLIIENATKRFDNFKKTFGFSTEFFQKHKKRYDILNKFFEGYNNQVKSYKFGSHQTTGCCGVVDVLRDIVNKKTVLKDIYIKPEKYLSDDFILWFFRGLASD